MANKQVWVSPNGSNWKVHTTFNSHSSNYTLKVVAVSEWTKLAKFHQCELIVQKMDGTIEYRNSFGNDPYPPRW